MSFVGKFCDCLSKIVTFSHPDVNRTNAGVCSIKTCLERQRWNKPNFSELDWTEITKFISFFIYTALNTPLDLCDSNRQRTLANLLFMFHLFVSFWTFFANFSIFFRLAYRPLSVGTVTWPRCQHGFGQGQHFFFFFFLGHFFFFFFLGGHGHGGQKTLGIGQLASASPSSKSQSSSEQSSSCERRHRLRDRALASMSDPPSLSPPANTQTNSHHRQYRRTSKKLKTPHYHTAKIRRLHLIWNVIGVGTWPHDRQTDGQTEMR